MVQGICIYLCEASTEERSNEEFEALEFGLENDEAEG